MDGAEMAMQLRVPRVVLRDGCGRVREAGTAILCMTYSTLGSRCFLVGLVCMWRLWHGLVASVVRYGCKHMCHLKKVMLHFKTPS